MAPKADASKKAASKAKSGPPKHAPFLDMIKDAILTLKERNGSSRQAIKKYIQANNNLGGLNESSFNTHISRALSTGEENGVFERPKGPSGPVKLKKAGPKPAAEKEAKPSKPAAPKKTTSTKKAPAAKKPAAKKASPTTTAKKASAAAKPKANASKPRAKKAAAPTAAPAVGEEKSVVLGKTKSGRVTKSKAPQASKPAAKKTGAAKKATTKRAAPKKKSATPKKAEAAS
jgi:histone H1/5